MTTTPQPSPAAVRIEASALQAWIARLCSRCDVPPEAAAATARLLVRTSLRGIDTHGVARVPPYIAHLENGSFKATARPVVSERNGTLHCEGDGGLGQYVASLALQAAMDKARTQAIVSCTLRDCGHLGALGMIVLDAAERGLVAVLCQQTQPLMALPGFGGRAIGNNPLAFAMPVPGGVPLVFDMALSEVARGRVADAVREGLPAIPAGWALDAQGQPTTDPQAAMHGFMLPMAGHKGMGLAMLVECLAGSLPGSQPGAVDTGAGSGGSTGAFLLVANPVLLAGQAAYDASVSQWLGHYRGAAGDAGRYPGQRQAASERERSAAGIPVPAALLRLLRALGERLGEPLP